MDKLKQELQYVDDTRSTLVDWAPGFDKDYRYTGNLRAYRAVMWVLGGGAILLGIIIFITAELPHIMWKEAAVTNKLSSSSRCLSMAEENNPDHMVTYLYEYTVDNKTYQSNKAFCEKSGGTKSMLYDPSNPSQAIPAQGNGVGAASMPIILLGGFFILIGYIGPGLLRKYSQWIGR